MTPHFLRLTNDLVNRLEYRAGRSAVLSRPVEVLMEPTNKCNNRCIMCRPHRHDDSLPQPPSGFLEWSTLENSAPLLKRARRVCASGFGEPLMHPEFTEIVAWLKRRVPFVYFFTNGTLLTQDIADALVAAGLDTVVFSMGGSSDGTFRHVRGVGLDDALEGLGNLQRAKARRDSRLPEVSFNVVQMNSVLPELQGIVDLAVEHRVSSISMPQMWVENAAAAGESVFANPRATAVIDEARAYAERHGVTLSASDNPPHTALCSAPTRTIFVAYDGACYSCCGERYRMGNVNDTPALRIWRSPGYRELRRRLSDDPAGICPFCPTAEPATETFQNPALHGRTVCADFESADGPAAIHTERVFETR